ncbi:MAG: ABC transporter permease [Spirochaetales bacterium]|nr:ABC transporter permease [Spirochaetales bacterium]MCF7937683.1 ABC transporter permease [Spirochaetales bacterium]
MQKFILRNFTLIRTLIAIALGIVISIFLIYVISETPGFSLKSFLIAPLLSKSRLSNIVENATPILFCGIAIAVAFRAKQFNIGAEGALFISAAVGTAFAVSTSMPIFIHIPLVLLVAAGAGAAWGFIPGFMKAKWGASELVASLMMNYVAYFLGLYLINNFFRDKEAGFLVSYRLPESARLAQFLEGTRMHYGVFLALGAALLIYYLMFHTTLGYEIRMTGHNQGFSRFGGIKIFKIIILVQVIEGALAGMGGMTEIMGIHGRFNWQMSPGYGWEGIIVAIIGREHPILIIFASFFLAYIRVGGQSLNLLADVPFELVTVIQAVIIILITAEAFLGRFKYKLTVNEAKREEAGDESLA